ncbi:MAG: hypothetical protein ACRDFW_03850 [bacterium]
MNSATIVQKLWNYCNILRDDRLSYGNYPCLAGRGKHAYIAAIHTALGRDYGPLTALFERVIRRASSSGA